MNLGHFKKEESSSIFIAEGNFLYTHMIKVIFYDKFN